MTPRLFGISSLGLLAAYAAAVQLSTHAGGPSFADLEPFPLGGLAGDGGAAVRALALGLGLTLGWGVPGVSLALLTDPRLRGSTLLARSLGLGVGYIFVAGLAYAMITGHAPHRVAFLVELALPCAVLVLRRHASSDEGRRRIDGPVVVALAVMVLLTAALWPKLRYEGMNGDGTEAYELSRSLEAHALPRWEMEGAEPPGRFGTPITVPFFTGAYAVFGHMTILGEGELAIRLPFLSSLVILVAVAAGLSPRRGRDAWLYTTAVAAVYLLWNAYYVGYEPPLDLAEPAGTDTLTMALWLVALRELVAGSTPLGAGFMALAAGTTYSAPLLTPIAFGFLWWLDRDRAKAGAPWIAGVAVAGLVALACVGWYSGDWRDWVHQFRSEYWQDLVEPGRRVASTPLFVQFLLLTGALPLVIPFGWSRVSPTGRLMSLTGMVYLAIVLGGSYKNLHYLMPLPWIFLGPALEASTAGLRLASTAILAGVVALSWPNDTAIRRETILLGTESCVQGLDYEAAALAAAPVYKAFDQPAWGERFGVGKHTFVRYALEVGGTDCVVGLSPAVPPGAIALIDGPATLWITDPDRYARWRFAQVPLPSSRLFPRPARLTHSAEAATWTNRLVFSETPGRWLLLTGFSDDPTRSTSITSRARLLVPVPEASRRDVRLGLQTKQAARLLVHVNGVSAPDVAAEPGSSEIMVRGVWRIGWNVLDLVGAEGVALEWVETQPEGGR